MICQLIVASYVTCVVYNNFQAGGDWGCGDNWFPHEKRKQ
jgi:hypothetical protein